MICDFSYTASYVSIFLSQLSAGVKIFYSYNIDFQNQYQNMISDNNKKQSNLKKQVLTILPANL